MYLYKERSFIHTYCTPEIEVAINMGHQIVKIYEVLHWSESEMYYVKNKTGGLFTKYINTFLKLKQQASGFPSEISTVEQKKDNIDKYLVREGIMLDKKKLKKIQA